MSGTATPMERYYPWRAGGSSAYGGDGRVGMFQLGVGIQFCLGAVAPCQRHCELGQLDGTEKVRRGVDQIAHHPGGGGLRQAGLMSWRDVQQGGLAAGLSKLG